MSETHPPLNLRGDLENDIRRNEVIEALRGVYDPELGMSVIELGLIRDIQFAEDRCKVEMILTTPFCPYAPTLMQEVRDTVEIITAMRTTVEMGTEMWNPSMMEEGAADDWGLF